MTYYTSLYTLLWCLVHLHIPSLYNAFTPSFDGVGRRSSRSSSSIGISVSSSIMRRNTKSKTALTMSGDGIAKGYTWHEEAFELEVTVNVPKETRAKDIMFQATRDSIDLRLGRPSDNNDDDNDEVILLDPSRKLRGRVSLEGTFWIISDPEESNSGDSYRQVTVTIEKQIRRPKDDFDVIDYDWKGIYFQEDEEEVSFRKYDESEELDVRDYAASLGVDIDNINMSLVDKSMFTSGLNLTQSSLDSLTESGLMKEVTQQSDGSEWVTDSEGERVPFNSMGGDAPPIPTTTTTTKPTVPFLDTNSPWHTTVPVDETEDFLQTNITKAEIEETTKTEQDKKREEKKQELKKQREQQAADPIATLTVARLKEILKSRGIKVSGNKQELQDRLRAEVGSMLVQDDNQDSKATEESNSESTI
jgi:hypothetical protein